MNFKQQNNETVVDFIKSFKKTGFMSTIQFPKEEYVALVLGNILPYLKEELVTYEFLDSSQVRTKAFRFESFIWEGELERSNYTIVSDDDYDVSDNAFVYHND